MASSQILAVERIINKLHVCPESYYERSRSKLDNILHVLEAALDRKKKKEQNIDMHQ